MTPPTDELAALRARAYGPAADIHDDPDALARLRALEAAARPVPARDDGRQGDSVARPLEGEQPATGGAAGSDPGAPAVPDAGRSAALDAVSPDGSAGDAPAVVPRSPRLIPRAWLVVWAASVALVAVVTGGIVFALASIRPVSDATGATQIATLDEPLDEADVPWLRRMFGTGRIVAFEYFGLVISIPSVGFFGDDVGPCLMVSDASGFSSSSDDGYSYSGASYYGCAAGPFPAAAQLVVGSLSPDALRERFPDGTALSFVLDGDVVGVFMAEPEAPSPPPA